LQCSNEGKSTNRRVSHVIRDAPKNLADVKDARTKHTRTCAMCCVCRSHGHARRHRLDSDPFSRSAGGWWLPALHWRFVPAAEQGYCCPARLLVVLLVLDSRAQFVELVVDLLAFGWGLLATV